MEKRRLLVIDDEREICDTVRQIGCRAGFDVYTSTSPRRFQAAIETSRPDVIMLDIVMPEMDGVEILKELAIRRCRAHIVMMTGYSQGYLSKAMDMGRGLGLSTLRGLVKPFDLADLIRALQDSGIDPTAARVAG